MRGNKGRRQRYRFDFVFANKCPFCCVRPVLGSLLVFVVVVPPTFAWLLFIMLKILRAGMNGTSLGGRNGHVVFMVISLSVQCGVSLSLIDPTKVRRANSLFSFAWLSIH
jgi:hypothetical protein